MNCQDCNIKKATVTYGLGHRRCDGCAEVFNQKIQAKRKEAFELEKAARAAHVCGEDDYSGCEECCEHGDIDFPSCLDCGKDMAEDYASAAYDRAKDIRKYGH